MNKKMILLGAVALVGCFVFASFDKMTLAQQKEQIAQAVTSKLDSFRVEKETACAEAAISEATVRYNAWVEAEAAKPAVGGKKKSYAKRTVPSGPKVDPLPQTTAPPATDPQKARGGAVKEGDIEAQKARGGAVKEGDVEQQKKRGGAVKQEGGGN